MNFERVIQHLCDARVDFVVIGGWAAIFHGSAHVTNDLDIWYSRDKENLRRLAGVLAPAPSWISGGSAIRLGCRHVGQWNDVHADN